MSTKYDYARIAQYKAADWSWAEIAERVGAPSPDGLRGNYYNWKARQAEEAPVAKGGKPSPFTPPPAYLTGDTYEFKSRKNNTFLFGIVGDKHVGSKYHRDDVLRDLYARFEAAGVDAVFDTGNWIDGEARFNKHDIVAHGMDNQIRRMADTHPKIPGVTTYAVWGDDHEGWYAQREGIDVGAHAQMIMESEGHAWVDLGYMEAHVKLLNANTGKEARMAVTHPGGGSAYAYSYRPQKIVESLEGGEKPAVLLLGHYHKMSADNVRNVWVIQTGCTQDQTPFMRKKPIDAHVGGVILGMEQDPNTGAIVSITPQLIRYFNKGYYNNRWSLSGIPARPARTPNPTGR